ncbi:tail protein X [Azohydromonas lata]|uniref:Tail protein X n=1 Tax=Azohydromonas lata TaxID=45677 RepID=A0ABU5IER6_9BURK|nr:tail protein X [Azohydromonas lata]MDZ5457010.1 tail protein X [Azohydromonas lata]
MNVIAQQGDTVDALCQRYLGTTSGGVVESTLELNRGLASLGPVLPEGTPVTLATPSTTTPTTSRTVSLWD